MINIGGNIGGMYVGSTEIGEAYVGSQLVYSKEPRPYDAEVEYLQGDGNQYIDTGFIPDDTCGMYIKVCYSVYTGQTQHIFGCIGDGTNSRWNMNYGVVSGNNLLVVNWNNTYNTNIGSTLNTFDEIRNNYLNSRKAYVNNRQVRSSSATLKSINRSAYLFTSHISSGYANTLIGRIGFLKISKGSDIVMDFIPVRVGQVGYMYDKISKQLFGNAGTGNFTLGSDV